MKTSRWSITWDWDIRSSEGLFARIIFIEKSEMETKTPKRRILVLHGYLQSGSVLYKKTGSFRKAIKNAEFVYVTAPNEAPPLPMIKVEESEEKQIDEKQFCWWKLNYLESEGLQASIKAETQFQGMQQSLDFLIHFLKENVRLDSINWFQNSWNRDLSKEFLAFLKEVLYYPVCYLWFR